MTHTIHQSYVSNDTMSVRYFHYILLHNKRGIGSIAVSNELDNNRPTQIRGINL